MRRVKALEEQLEAVIARLNHAEEMILSSGIEITRLNKLLSERATEAEEMKKLLNEQTEDIAEQLANRWESSLQSIAAFNPFDGMDAGGVGLHGRKN